jgi:hypothetical protein
VSDFDTGGQLQNDYLYDDLGGRPGFGDVLTDFTGGDYYSNDYDLITGSLADDAGTDISSYLITTGFASGFNYARDLDGNARTVTAPSVGPLE